MSNFEFKNSENPSILKSWENRQLAGEDFRNRHSGWITRLPCPSLVALATKQACLSADALLFYQALLDCYNQSLPWFKKRHDQDSIPFLMFLLLLFSIPLPEVYRVKQFYESLSWHSGLQPRRLSQAGCSLLCQLEFLENCFTLQQAADPTAPETPVNTCSSHHD